MSTQKYTQLICPDGFIPLQEVARITGISQFVLYRWCRLQSKGVKSLKKEGKWFISEETVNKLKKEI